MKSTDRSFAKPYLGAALTLLILLSMGAAPEAGTGHPAANPECRGAAVDHPGYDQGGGPAPERPVRWTRPDEERIRREQDRWCAAAGRPLAYTPDTGAAVPPPPLEDIAIVVWNTGVGAGALDRFLHDLRSGHLTGTPVHHFVLLLQEVYRAGEAVPADPPSGSRTVRRIAGGASARDRSSIGEVARSHGLHLFYAPSMRNGQPEPTAGADEDPPEDRGNAILATLPLTRLEIVELPVHKQRRVAVAATIEVGRPDGGADALRLVSVHLDHVAGWSRFHESLGTARDEDAERLVAAFAAEENIVVGGDFNSWFGGIEEPAIRRMRAAFPEPGDPPLDATFGGHALLPSSRVLDHLFFRLPAGWNASYQVVRDWYGSDHRPLLGRISHPE